MADNRFTGDLSGAEFADVSLRGARFTSADLSGVVMRGILIEGAEIDSPWLIESGGPLTVNGVDVTGFVDARLNERFPGRELRTATDPPGLVAAWAVLEETWAGAVARVEGMPTGTADISVAGEWSFAQTLRHLLSAIDTWLRRAIQELPEPYHPMGLPYSDYEADGNDPSIFSQVDPAWAEVLETWAGRQAQVREFIAGVTVDDLGSERRNPWSPKHPETILSCLHTILEEGWEHYRYATRDLDQIELDRLEADQRNGTKR